MSDKSVHLLCSSGGVRCFSYIGAYRALVNAGYTISGVSASSMGSVIGMLFCCGLSPDIIEDKVLKNPISNYLKKKVWFKWLAFLQFPYAIYNQPDYHQLLIDFYGNDPELKDLQVPYSTLALDLRMQELLSFSRESHPNMKASELLQLATAIPPLFAPIELDKRLLVDAGIATESPGWVALAESQGHPIVVLRSAPSLNTASNKRFDHFLTKMIQSAASGNDRFSLQQMPNTIMVEINCGEQKAEDFSISNEKIEALIMAGQRAMEQKLVDCNGNLSSFIHVDNIAKHQPPVTQNDKARERSINLLQKFKEKTEGRHQVFISYSHKDTEWFNKIQLVLAPVEAFHGIKVWDDKEIEPGEYWHEAISNALSQTKIALCIVSPNFLNSRFISSHELNYFIEETKKQKVRLFLIAASGIDIQDSPLHAIQFANDPARPLDNLSEPEQLEVLNEIVKDMVRLIGV
jgi:predicted acylesterase/phospholipase RssA